jgi:type III restriction enzyme
MGYLRNILKDTTKSVFEHVLYDSAGVERTFAEQLEKNESVKLCAKLPAWFKVPTPLGSYNPDWAVLVEVNGEERLYFVVETKGSLFTDDLRDNEAAKIACGKAHFQALAIGPNPARYIQATKVDDIMDQC